jgi:transcriptional regulator with XRE-family HTH domain
MTKPPEMPGGTFAANLRTAREWKGYSYLELANRAGVDVGGIWRLENSDTSPRLTTVIALAGALDMTAAELVTGL